VNIAFFLLGDSLASEFSVPMFWNTLFDPKRSFNKKNNCDKIARVFIQVKVWLNDLYSSPNIVWVIKSRRMRWAGHVACMGEERGVYRVLLGKPKGRRPLGRPTRR